MAAACKKARVAPDSCYAKAKGVTGRILPEQHLLVVQYCFDCMTGIMYVLQIRNQSSKA